MPNRIKKVSKERHAGGGRDFIRYTRGGELIFAKAGGLLWADKLNILITATVYLPKLSPKKKKKNTSQT